MRRLKKVEILSALEITILLFIFAAEILGEIRSFYIRYPIWDTMLHTINGFLAAAIGFSMVDLLKWIPRIKSEDADFLRIVEEEEQENEGKRTDD